MYVVSDGRSEIARSTNATSAVKAAEQYFQCGVERRSATIKQLQRYGQTLAFNCIAPEFWVRIERV